MWPARNLGGWLTFESISRTVDLIAKLAAVVAVVAALEVFASEPRLGILRIECAPSLDRQTLGEIYGRGSLESGPIARLAVALSPNRSLRVLRAGELDLDQLAKRAPPSRACPARWADRTGVDFDSPLAHAALVTVELAVMNTGDATATNVSVTGGPQFEPLAATLRLRPRQVHVIRLRSARPREAFSFHDPVFTVFYDSERRVNERLLSGLVAVALIVLGVAVFLDIARSRPESEPG